MRERSVSREGDDALGPIMSFLKGLSHIAVALLIAGCGRPGHSGQGRAAGGALDVGGGGVVRAASDMGSSRLAALP